MKLYYSPGACSLSPHIALREANVPFALERVDIRAETTQTGASYLAVNPKGCVPALELDDGLVLTEGAVIVQYVADLRPASKLAPAQGSFERVRLQEWLNFIATELHKGLSPLYAPGAGDEFKATWRSNRIEPSLDFLAQSLTGKSFLMGETFTVADGYAYYVLRAWQSGLIKGDLSRWQVLRDYSARIGERPAVQAALAAEAAPA
jgi:glutathione S-transferase